MSIHKLLFNSLLIFNERYLIFNVLGPDPPLALRVHVYVNMWPVHGMRMRNNPNRTKRLDKRLLTLVSHH